ncbi:hypothetical protein BU24DRAFT_406244 [Aaosphaeria arxii CBS 175.79]|uniref:Uncharacterized protein n=1 Tax=Aaosphaeria arxii CBS 175.79 TaxID=1450172 RepID=A0A6A5Y247_9PLEO|nr:uncharacterized protein BU24DRAFT_406244 [Aaosphaeria arxii CBS 175.79]KAF2019592.1 hypothetical protein BU24DRAFT_406244 [Aaosphaeria arxii CBS 175.79]
MPPVRALSLFYSNIRKHTIPWVWDEDHKQPPYVPKQSQAQHLTTTSSCTGMSSCGTGSKFSLVYANVQNWLKYFKHSLRARSPLDSVAVLEIRILRRHGKKTVTNSFISLVTPHARNRTTSIAYVDMSSVPRWFEKESNTTPMSKVYENFWLCPLFETSPSSLFRLNLENNFNLERRMRSERPCSHPKTTTTMQGREQQIQT